MLIRTSLTFALATSISFFACAQSPKVSSIKSTADSLFQQKEYSDALESYLKLSKIQLANGESNYRIGMCYMHSLHQERALPYFKKAEKYGFDLKTTPHIVKNIHNKNTSLDLDFNLARCYHLHHEFDEAVRHYLLYEKKVDTVHKKVHDKEFKIVNHLIREAQNGAALIKNPVKGVELHNLGKRINTEYPDYAPVLTADGKTLVFTSRRPNSRHNEKVKEDDNMYLEDIYAAQLLANGEWGTAELLSDNINTEHHESACGIAPDGEHLFIYQNNVKLPGGNILVSTMDKKANDWSKPVKMHHHINTTSFEAGGSVTDNSESFYFVSDRPGGEGGRDIYIAKRNKKGEWTHPVNLGEEINTEFDEESPFISPDGKTLYFSSKGHNSMGGYDIFKSEYDPVDKKWLPAVNLGFPINSADDDLFFVVTHDGKKAYFSTHHEDSFGHYDIYEIYKNGGF